MKNSKKLLAVQKTAGLIALAAIIGFTMAACDDAPDTPPAPASTTYSSTDAAGNEYTLVITEDGARAAAAGDSYKLTITFTNGTVKISMGKVSSVTASGAFELQPSANGAEPFTVAVSGESITAITGEIAVEGGETVPAPTFPQGNNNNGGEEGDPSLWTYGSASLSGEEIEITRYKGTETTVTIPAQIDGKPVVSIRGWMVVANGQEAQHGIFFGTPVTSLYPTA